MRSNDTSHRPTDSPPSPTVETTTLASAVGGVEHISTADCWKLVEDRSFGRLAVAALDGVPDIFPVNYTVHDGSIYIRSAPGSKLMALAAHPVAAFEIDGQDGGFQWSVVLRGSSARLAVDKEIRESGVLHLVSATPTPKHNFIRVTPSTISGRRFAVEVADGSVTGPEIVRSPAWDSDLPRAYIEKFVWPHIEHEEADHLPRIAHMAPR